MTKDITKTNLSNLTNGGGGIAPSVNFDLLYCADYYKDTLKKQHFVDKHLSFLQIENAYCLPSFQDGEKTLGGICTKDKTFVRSSALHAFTSGVYNFDEKKAIQMYIVSLFRTIEP